MVIGGAKASHTYSHRSTVLNALICNVWMTIATLVTNAGHCPRMEVMVFRALQGQALKT